MIKQKEIAISVHDVKKSFKVFYDKGYDLKEKVIFRKRNHYEIHEVIRGISFGIKKGEAVGIIGHNGCGKSTLLKMLTRIMYPDAGTIDIKGKVSALIELGAGFHPDMSGRENIYTNASIFGFTKSEIDNCIDEIIDFSELGEYIDNPVRTYSSGMYMRLAFSVAINVNADVLLVDEILAVGDAAFQAKCFNKMREIKSKGTTIVIVSHSLGQIEQICDKSVWIKDGLIEKMGDPLDVHPYYLEYMEEQARESLQKKSSEKDDEEAKVEDVIETEDLIGSESETETEQNHDVEQTDTQGRFRWGSGEAKIIKVELVNSKGKETDTFMTNEEMDIRITFEAKKELMMPVVGVGFFRSDGVSCYGTNTQLEKIKLHLMPGIHNAVFGVNRMSFLPGEYTLDVAIHDENGFNYDYYRFIKSFKMFSITPDVGLCRLEHSWTIK